MISPPVTDEHQPCGRKIAEEEREGRLRADMSFLPRIQNFPEAQQAPWLSVVKVDSTASPGKAFLQQPGVQFQHSFPISKVKGELYPSGD